MGGCETDQDPHSISEGGGNAPKVACQPPKNKSKKKHQLLTWQSFGN